MTISATQVNAVDKAKMATGSYLDDATTPATPTITVGFSPRYIRVENVTDRIGLEWFYGMASDSALKTVAAGTRTLETSSAIVIGSDGKSFQFVPTQNKQYRWQACE